MILKKFVIQQVWSHRVNKSLPNKWALTIQRQTFPGAMKTGELTVVRNLDKAFAVLLVIPGRFRITSPSALWRAE